MRIQFILSTLCFFAAFIGLPIYLGKRLLEAKSRKGRCTVQVECECIGHNSRYFRGTRNRSGHRGYAPIWSYHYNGQKTYTSKLYKRYKKVKVGATSTLMINPDIPTECYEDGEKRLNTLTFIIVLIFLLALLNTLIPMFFTAFSLMF